MPVYEYRCPTDGKVFEYFKSEPTEEHCPTHGNVLRRKYSFAVPKLFVPHYNHSVGRYVTSESDFRSALKKASDEASATTGVEHNYVPIDYREAMRNLPSEEGLAEQQKAKVDAGH